MSVVCQPTTAPTRNFQIIPECQTRELQIHNENPTEDLAHHSTVKVVATVNTTIGTNDTVATCQLPSSDVILTFQELIPLIVLSDQSWVQWAFRATTQLHESEFTVIVKGLPVDCITRVDSGRLLLDIQVQVPTLVKIKVEPPCAPTVKFTTAILHLHSAEAVTCLCERGLVWQAQIFNCEPYSAELQICQCFSCHQFGHIA
jgi:hypothetical protein